MKRLGFGGMTIQRVRKKEAIRVVNRALDLGINFIDTARAYTDSEEKIGEVIKFRRKECYLSTRSPRCDYDGFKRDMEQSFDELNTDYIDIYEVHDVSSEERFDELFSSWGALRALNEAKQAGKIGWIGVTSHSWEILPKLIRTNEFDVVMLVYNPVTRDGEREVIRLAKEYNVGTLVMKVMGNGRLLELVPKVEKSSRRLTPRECIRFALSNPDLSVILVGCKSIEEVEEDFKIADNFVPLSPEERVDICNFGDKFTKSYCWGCNYCMPCPEGIDIPSVMKLLDFPDWEWPAFRSGYSKLSVKPDVCNNCGECESRCPQNLRIIEMLKKVQNTAK